MAGTNLAAKGRKVATEKLGRTGVEIGNVVVATGTVVAVGSCIRATADTAVLVTAELEAATGSNAAAEMAR